MITDMNRAALTYAAIPEEGPDELNGDKLEGFKDGINWFVELCKLHPIDAAAIINSKQDLGRIGNTFIEHANRMS